MCASGFITITRNSKDISIWVRFFYIIYTDYDQKNG